MLAESPVGFTRGFSMTNNISEAAQIKIVQLIAKELGVGPHQVAAAVALLDEIAEITPRAEWVMRTNTEREIHPGKPLPDDLASAPLYS